MNTVVFESKSDEWETPQALFDGLNLEFNFNYDPCATETNHKCECFETMETDGLSKKWSGKRVFCNPPYSDIARWAKKCRDEVESGRAELAVMLVPSRTDTRWFHDYIYRQSEIRFIRGRLRFSNSANVAPFPSMIAIFRMDDWRAEE